MEANGVNDPAVEKKEERAKWDNKLQYVLSCVGFAVGLGNVWRFPYFCQTYGGGFIEECEQSTSVDYFWYRETLNISPDISSFGDGLQWRMVVCLVAAWLVLYLCVIRGFESFGKAIYFTATFPYFILLILLVRSLTLPGATNGLIYLITPDLTVLSQPRVWLDAATQIFFSLSLGFGGLIAFSSYNPLKNDCEVDAVTVAVINSFTSIFASIPIFSVLGFKATMAYWDCLNKNILLLSNEFDIQDGNITKENYGSWISYLNATQYDRITLLDLKNCDLQNFLDQGVSGTGLAFIVFTEAIVRMPVPQVWAILFFIMLFTLGLSSMFGNIESILTPLLDLNVFPKYIPKEMITAMICLVSFLIALIFTTSSGNYWLAIFDKYGTGLPLLIITFFELIGVIYVYGINNFCDGLEFMTGRRPNIYWHVTWRFISPLLLFIVFVAHVAVEIQYHSSYEAWNPDYVEFPKKEEKVYTDWVIFICAFLVILPTIFIPLTALYQFIKCKFGGCQEEGSSIDNPAFEL
ncbi:sodium-dependent neutral amino acid transporter B(0)AT3-like isoform X3 [Hypanus sabinus]|uniref:sodium-dependent neutral amino acid transporter B(0)AT3-like isoform X3 n=1 Tax=Hypanus sabinus TaxID=79690 RepID=UPI0028C4DE82|nr:sodium-dependent neutral amino acid transporter B(0)AT3-like isoform X3 [Hypanus sabinus]